MLATLAVALSLLIAQPFALVVQVRDASGGLHALLVGRYADRSTCEADRAAIGAALAAKAYVLEVGGAAYLAVASGCIVRGGVSA